jgi:hypothetical protein
MAAKSSLQFFLAWGQQHGQLIFGAATIGITVLAGAISLKGYVDNLKMELKLLAKDLEKERELRSKDRVELQQRTDLVVKTVLSDVLHHADFEGAARLLRGSQGASTRPSTG